MALIGALAKGSFKAAFGGGLRRMATGAIIGGVYGGATSENVSSTGVFRDVVVGAAAGLGIGALTTKAAFAGAIGLGRRLPRAALQTTRTAGRTGLGLSKFAWRHPKTSLALGVAGLGMYGLATSGYGEAGADAQEMGIMAQQAGVSSAGFAPGMGSSYRQNSRQMFMDSTFGLVNGLHSRRHA